MTINCKKANLPNEELINSVKHPAAPGQPNKIDSQHHANGMPAHEQLSPHQEKALITANTTMLLFYHCLGTMTH